MWGRPETVAPARSNRVWSRLESQCARFREHLHKGFKIAARFFSRHLVFRFDCARNLFRASLAVNQLYDATSDLVDHDHFAAVGQNDHGQTINALHRYLRMQHWVFRIHKFLPKTPNRVESVVRAPALVRSFERRRSEEHTSELQ